MYYICQPQRIEENLLDLTRTSPQSECHEKVYLHQLLKFCTLLKIVPCTEGLQSLLGSFDIAGLERNSSARCLRILLRLLTFAMKT